MRECSNCELKVTKKKCLMSDVWLACVLANKQTCFDIYTKWHVKTTCFQSEALLMPWCYGFPFSSCCVVSFTLSENVLCTLCNLITVHQVRSGNILLHTLQKKKKKKHKKKHIFYTVYYSVFPELSVRIPFRQVRKSLVPSNYSLTW